MDHGQLEMMNGLSHHDETYEEKLCFPERDLDWLDNWAGGSGCQDGDLAGPGPILHDEELHDD